ncbi:MAG TPA: hypothetical protein VL588_11355 [Bdellovibrionota bacterium]|jgi:hypothetical protein|nr:hypothetical protein [Bdellovibrionota bacterium]
MSKPAPESPLEKARTHVRFVRQRLLDRLDHMFPGQASDVGHVVDLIEQMIQAKAAVKEASKKGKSDG